MKTQIPALEIPNHSKLMPVIVIDKVADAVPLAEALVAGGISMLEVTLRTPVAIDAMKAIIDAVPNAIVGAGTVTNVKDLEACLDIGCQFLVSPGATHELLAKAHSTGATLLPGIATVSEAMTASDAGCELLKFFPASINGGPKAIKAFGGPLVDTKFCPTGGVNLDNMNEYLSIPNVVCVGGSWVAPSKLVNAGDWGGITQLAKEAIDKIG